MKDPAVSGFWGKFFRPIKWIGLVVLAIIVGLIVLCVRAQFSGVTP